MAPASSVVSSSPASLARALEPPGFLAARSSAEPPLSLTERMAHGEAAPSSEADMDARRRALQAKGWQVAQAQGAQLLQVRAAAARLAAATDDDENDDDDDAEACHCPISYPRAPPHASS